MQVNVPRVSHGSYCESHLRDYAIFILGIKMKARGGTRFVHCDPPPPQVHSVLYHVYPTAISLGLDTKNDKGHGARSLFPPCIA